MNNPKITPELNTLLDDHLNKFMSAMLIPEPVTFTKQMEALARGRACLLDLYNKGYNSGKGEAILANLNNN